MTVKDQKGRKVLVAVADLLVHDLDVVDFLDLFVNRCVEVLDVTAAGARLVDHQGTLDVVAGSTESARTLELSQLRHHEGPCSDCLRSGQAVECEDLAAGGQRWPVFSRAAVAAGFAAVHALPMRADDTVIGGLDLFGDTPGPWDADTAVFGRMLADIATVSLLRQRTLRHHEVVIEQLETALTSRVLIEQAKGVLAERMNTTVDSAFALLRGYARRNRVRLAGVAAAVVEGTADIPALAAGTGGAPRR
ncbi:GAF and ANTAR domain-containing protein [Lentzea alba]|uniref:GAF and ANTAR domain-containing protein n=1 Tax=Lentzea alba TaxID=2714351 RepID=UPI0039BF4FFF